MPTLLEYINQLQKEHHYRIKMVVPPGEHQLERIERHMKKYDALEVGRPEKLMLQSMPPDFPNYGGHEIVIIDTITRLPLSPFMLESELRTILGLPEGTLRVFSQNDPLMREEELQAKRAADGDNEPLLGSDYSDKDANPVKAEDTSGDEYVGKMLDAAAKDDRRKVVLAKETDAKASGPWLNCKEPSDSPLTKTKGYK